MNDEQRKDLFERMTLLDGLSAYFHENGMDSMEGAYKNE